MTDDKGFTDHVDKVNGHVLDLMKGRIVDVALFQQNMWWTDEQVAGLVGQQTLVSDKRTGETYQAVITKAWVEHGMVCVRLEPAEHDDD